MSILFVSSTAWHSCQILGPGLVHLLLWQTQENFTGQNMRFLFSLDQQWEDAEKAEQDAEQGLVGAWWHDLNFHCRLRLAACFCSLSLPARKSG